VPIVKPDAPQASIEALHASLPTPAGSAGVRKTAPNFAAILASPQSLARPGLSYPVYTLGLTDIVSGAGLGKAKLAAWRHEFSHANEVVSAEVSSGRRPKFLQLNVASKLRSVQHELQSVAAGEVFASRSYELRLLQISALELRALWLKAESGSRGDVVVPLAPARRELTANQHYTPNEFIAALKAAARTMLAAEAPGKGA
jgi:hypothetical protein